MPSIECSDCNAPYEAVRSDAVRCPSCRLLVKLAWSKGYWSRSKRCRKCHMLYHPVTIGDRLCGACSPGTQPDQPCRLCKKDRPPFERARVCAQCVKGHKSRNKVLGALRNGQAARRERYNWDAA